MQTPTPLTLDDVMAFLLTFKSETETNFKDLRQEMDVNFKDIRQEMDINFKDVRHDLQVLTNRLENVEADVAGLRTDHITHQDENRRTARHLQKTIEEVHVSIAEPFMNLEQRVSSITV